MVHFSFNILWDSAIEVIFFQESEKFLLVEFVSVAMKPKSQYQHSTTFEITSLVSLFQISENRP